MPHNLAAEKYTICQYMSVGSIKISIAFPMQPKGGTFFLYNLSENVETWDLKKRQIRCALLAISQRSMHITIADLHCRCNQYRWLHGGTYPVKSSSIDLEGNGSKTGDPQFRRFEYWGYYLRDNTIFKEFKDQNSKTSTKPFIRSAPHVKDKVW